MTISKVEYLLFEVDVLRYESDRARAEIKVSAEVTMKYGHDLDEYEVIREE